ncbi:MAG: transcriptional regulator, partial [Chloroflexi bacterium]|nr:transcriptional regulator [Chloroflexota bacterium]
MTNDAKTSARQAFRRARGQHLFRAIWTALNGESNELLKWEEIRRKLRAGTPIYRGVQSVEVALIQGSVNRYRDFDRAFMPSQAHTRARWWSIGEARYSDVDLPPVQLYKVGEVYFVMDGNHRVSVARQLGQEFIDAEVYESRVRVPVRPDISPESLDVISEKLDFVEYTGIDELRPAVDIELSLRGGYYR